MNAVRVTYTGRVQGVGFRATCRHLARGLAVTGRVRNLPTGEVELHAKGEASEVAALLERIAGRFRGNIASARSEPAAVAGHTSFEITHT